MLKLAMVDGTAAFHGWAFSSLINRVDATAFKKNEWPLYDGRLADRAVITHAWGDNAAATKRLAHAAGIKHVVKKPKDVIGEVDGVLLVDNMEMTHQRHARTFLRAGVPTFIDKPIAPRLDEARRILEQANEYGTPVMSASALRYATEVADRKALAERVGDVVTCVATGANELFYYGIHPLTLMCTIMNSPIRSVVNVGRKGQDVVRVRFANGKQGVLIVYEKDMGYTLEVCIHGTKGHERIHIADHPGFYGNMLGDFLNMVETGKPPVPYEEILSIIEALLLAKRSRRDQQEYPVTRGEFKFKSPRPAKRA